MKDFNISRINTVAGIFRLSGKVILINHNFEFEFSHVDIMSTDGWCQLDIQSKSTKSILDKIKLDVSKHLSLSESDNLATNKF